MTKDRGMMTSERMMRRPALPIPCLSVAEDGSRFSPVDEKHILCHKLILMVLLGFLSRLMPTQLITSSHLYWRNMAIDANSHHDVIRHAIGTPIWLTLAFRDKRWTRFSSRV